MSKHEFIENSTAISNDLPSTNSTRHHACLTLDQSDRLRLIRFPATTIHIVRKAILASWPRGLQNEKEYAGAYEFKFCGYPWLGQGIEAVQSRVMMMSVLSALYHQGWYIVASTDVSKKQHDKDLLIFQLGVPPPTTSFFAVSFNERDKLRLIGAPYEVISAVQEIIGTNDIRHEKWIYSETAYQFKLHNRPWTAIDYKMVTSRMELLELLDCFESLGWELYASINLSTGHEGSHTDTWFCRRSNR
ncbi:unnamed protein product [Rotaria sp. Silwood2]|nr:unnamed protein product [Rotaria sp. Silwood2]CAF3113233.1 unnamed protein product [Rotaria sp. Silwood2]CAF4420829.1 unnamed protein product [Rotaria sp. Silwood2]